MTHAYVYSQDQLVIYFLPPLDKSRPRDGDPVAGPASPKILECEFSTGLQDAAFPSGFVLSGVGVDLDSVGDEVSVAGLASLAD